MSKLPTPVIPNESLLQNSLPRGPSAIRGLKLPSISLPEFSGDYKDWRVFYDTFYALIHTNRDLPDIQKFHYLRAAVKGEAAQLIESVDICAADYVSTWDTLVNRYSNEYLMKKRRLQALFDIPRMERETAAELHTIVDVFERHVKGLNQMGEPTEAWSTILEHLLCSRLHDDTLKAWEDYASTMNQPTYKNLVDFLHRRNRVLESISVNHHHAPQHPVVCSHVAASKSDGRGNSANFASGSASLKCHACEQRHPLLKCFKFTKMSTSDRLNVVNSKRLCLNCFRSTHYVRECPSQDNCRVCGRRHHTMIHPGYDETYARAVPDSRSSRFQQPTRATVHVTQCDEDLTEPVLSAMTTVCQSTEINCMPLRTREKNVILPTAVVIIVDCYGKEHLVRALLDCASQANLITEKMAQLLRLRRTKTSIIVNGIGDHPKLATESVTTQIRSRRKHFTSNIDFIILEKIIPRLPGQNFPVDHWKIPDDLFLADPGFNNGSSIDLLISNEHFFTFFTSAARIELSKSLPLLIDSVFGWLVSGSVNSEDSPSSTFTCSIRSMPLVSLDERLEKFWKMEELPIRTDRSPQEKECEKFYARIVSRTPEGRYVVRLPRHPNFETMLGCSETIARKRFELLERRLERNPQLKDECHRFMAEYLSLGHMRLVENEDCNASAAYCFLPHHPVIKDASTTTKVRVVFDASAKTSTGFSLNESLLVGPVVQDDLVAIVLRFRTYPVALVADIEKMYRQVLLHPEDTALQRIFWRFHPDQPIQIFELLTVTYGMAPSSFLATRTLQQLACDEGSAYPNGAPALRKGFYVDDFIGGASTITEAICVRNELIDLLGKGGCSLRKWASNEQRVLKDLDEDKIAVQNEHRFDTEETVKTLGICWEPKYDTLRFDPEMRQKADKLTKRSILSAISQLFDPLGLVSPVIVRAKIIMQQLWSLSCGWDDEIPEPVQVKWKRYVQQLQQLSNFRIDRYALLPNSKVQLHTFADASEQAYGCCIYARSIDTHGNIRVKLLASKSRVAPLKRVTLPRLELCAADLAAKLHSCVIQALNIEVTASYFWSDSMVTLQWLRSEPNVWKTFVANRVSEIQTTTQGSFWNHVAGKQNPADLVSRGMEVDEFLISKLWTNGPDWLGFLQNGWPITNIPDYPEQGIERRKQQIVSVVSSHPAHNSIFNLCSSYKRLVRIVAYCFKFIKNAQAKTRSQPVPFVDQPPNQLLSVQNIAAANTRLIQLAQADSFKEEIHNLKSFRNARTYVRYVRS
ncbi:uncharacterized protein LOC131689266 isoform X1 [Topomyia yanbarensis]|uniref:uncharacterized protein LOC131689266 isoform X1 n=1 Tax=Topomyia yanbarensis TaxID=2498891 RepID=UPI00273BB6A4|nr:uncharacterized protein LOC131689266 isoform X1 [Topomyia yanbarensis]